MEMKSPSNINLGQIIAKALWLVSCFSMLDQTISYAWIWKA